jgi:hypothetical protein
MATTPVQLSITNVKHMLIIIVVVVEVVVIIAIKDDHA